MLAWLMLRPKLIVGIGAAALVLSMWAAWKWEVRGLKKVNASQAQTIKEKELANAELRGGLHESQINNTALAQKIDQVNARITGLQAAARADQADAILKAVRTVADGQRAAAQIIHEPASPAAPLPSDADSLNARIRAILGDRR